MGGEISSCLRWEGHLFDGDNGMTRGRAQRGHIMADKADYEVFIYKGGRDVMRERASEQREGAAGWRRVALGPDRQRSTLQYAH